MTKSKTPQIDHALARITATASAVQPTLKDPLHVAVKLKEGVEQAQSLAPNKEPPISLGRIVLYRTNDNVFDQTALVIGVSSDTIATLLVWDSDGNQTVRYRVHKSYQVDASKPHNPFEGVANCWRYPERK